MMRRSASWQGVVLTCAIVVTSSAGLRGDTVFLENGSTIDGMVVGQKDGSLLVQIGNLGRMEIPEKEVQRVEKNSRTGYIDPRRDVQKSEVPDSPESAEPEARGADVETKMVEEELDPQLEEKIKGWVYDLTRQRTTARVRAERHLSKTGPAVVTHLLPLTHHSSDLTRVAVFRIFKKVGGDDTIEPSLIALEDNNQFVRKMAWESLKNVSDRKYRFPWADNASERERSKAIRRWRDWWETELNRRDRAAEAEDTPATAARSGGG